ncbi:unnamed protein product [Closterium sp. NIES-64]|nr:unnamed protein product [Closterium sp. NIES-64]
MATPNVLTFDAEGRAIDFAVWIEDLQLYLLCDWATRDAAAARLAVRRHLPSSERAHFSQCKTAQALYDAVVARYSSPSSATLSRLMLPFLFPDLASFPTVADLVTHLRASDTRYRAALPAEFRAANPPPMYITLYFLVTRLPESLRVVRDQFLSVCPTTLTVDLLEESLLAAEKSIVAVGASRGDPRTPIFEGCGPPPLLPSVASAAAADLVGFESVGAASAPVADAALARARGQGSGWSQRGGGGGGGGGGGVGWRGGGGGSGVVVAAVEAEVAAEVVAEEAVVSGGSDGPGGGGGGGDGGGGGGGGAVEEGVGVARPSGAALGVVSASSSSSSSHSSSRSSSSALAPSPALSSSVSGPPQ